MQYLSKSHVTSPQIRYKCLFGNDISFIVQCHYILHGGKMMNAIKKASTPINVYKMEMPSLVLTLVLNLNRY